MLIQGEHTHVVFLFVSYSVALWRSTVQIKTKALLRNSRLVQCVKLSWNTENDAPSEKAIRGHVFFQVSIVMQKMFQKASEQMEKKSVIGEHLAAKKRNSWQRALKQVRVHTGLTYEGWSSSGVEIGSSSVTSYWWELGLNWCEVRSIYEFISSCSF